LLDLMEVEAKKKVRIICTGLIKAKFVTQGRRRPVL
jgi:hypothetical protein